MENIKLNEDPTISYESKHRYLSLFGMMWISIMTLAIFTSMKTFNLFGFVFATNAIVYPITYIFSDIFTEIYGYRVSRKVIWGGLFCLLTVSIIAYIYTIIPAGDGFTVENEAAFNYIFKSSPIIAIAALISFSSGEFVNSITLAKLKIKTRNKYKELRYILSTLFGQTVDNGLFCLIIFMFTNFFTAKVAFNIWVTATVFCTLWEMLAMPITKRCINWIKAKEGLDTYDIGTNFNPFKIK